MAHQQLRRCRQTCAGGSTLLGLLAVCFLATVSSSSRATAPNQPTSNQPTSRASQGANAAKIPAADQPAEQQVLEFVRQHQPPLLKLMKFLKDKQPALYAQALKEMARSQQRLESLASRDAELYDLELQLWQVRSELRLLAAELAATSPRSKAAEPKRPSQGKDHAAELRALVEQEATYELARLKLLRARIQKELSRLETQIETLSTTSDEQIARKLQQWQNRINKSSRK